jgi:hypothetical protein
VLFNHFLRDYRVLKAQRRAAIMLLWVAGMTWTGCAKPTEPDPHGEPGLTIVRGASVADTVEAELPQALIVEVRDPNGKAVPNVMVTFAGSLRNSRPTVTFSSLTGRYYAGLAADTSDSSGRARVLVRLGTEAGPAEAIISVPALGLQETATFTVLTGAPARVIVAPQDSALYVGREYTLRGTVHDRLGNPRDEAVSYTTGASAVSVSGAAVRGERVGRGFVVAHSGTVADTAWVSIVPPGVLAAYEFPTYYNGNGPDIRQPGRIVTLNTDGSDFRVLLEQQPAVIPFSYAVGMHPSWAPSGAELAYVNANELMIADRSGASREVFAGSEPVHEEYTPLYSPDGNWIYFTLGRDGYQRTFWRVHRDGTAARQVSPNEDWGIEVMPSPDPTGDFVAYQTNRATNSPVDFTIRTLRVSTGEVSTIDVPGMAPRWSPTGEWIAYIGTHPTDPYRSWLRLMRPDGTERRFIGSELSVHPSFSWSDDGEWIAVSGNQPRADNPYAVGLSLVNISTGEVLPLRFNHTLVQPSWRR